jgi:hypothetical protein
LCKECITAAYKHSTSIQSSELARWNNDDKASITLLKSFNQAAALPSESCLYTLSLAPAGFDDDNDELKNS